MFARLCISTRTEDDCDTGLQVCLEVQDSGSGMTEETKARIFDPFFTTKLMGRGLGLAAVSGIVRGHGGTMRVESEIGKGSTFQIYFPAVAKTVHVEDIIADKKYACAGGTILVVDDEPVLRVLARTILEHEGYHVLLAENGRQGVEVFAQHADTISAILLDMNMPVMNGDKAFVLIREIRDDVPIVVSTGYAEAMTRALFKAGATVEFIQKPYTASQLRDKMLTMSKPKTTVSGSAAN